MRGLKALVAVSLLLASCGRPASTPNLEAPAAGSLCQDFIDATIGLADQPDYESYVSMLHATAEPVYAMIVDSELNLPSEVLMAWENIAFGSPGADDIEAVHYLGGVLVADIGPECEELGRNVGQPPPSRETAQDPPAVELVPLYEPGTIDHACDVFIQTLFAWSDARSSSAEIGIHIADVTDSLIAGLESHDISAGLEDLAVYSDKYRSLPIVQAHEEAEAYLAGASRALAEVSAACGHMSTWRLDSDPEQIDLDYYRFRWDSLGYDSYTARITVEDPDGLRSVQQMIVVIDEGEVAEVYDIRTGDMIGPPAEVPLTVEGLFDAIERSGDTGAWFHPVLGYPWNAEGVGMSEVSEGADFDRTILGSTADAVATVEAVPEFVPGKACGSARVPGGEPIPSVRPLDDDARQALDALAAKEEEGGYFSSNFEYGIFERTDDRLVLLGEDDSGQLSDALFVREGGQWRVTTWGTCNWKDDGFQVSPWALDPEMLFDPGSTNLHLVVRDYCGTHTEYGNEYIVVGAVSVDAVEIVVWQAERPPPPPEGPEFMDLGCSLGQVVQLTVVLAEPIGDRELIGATDPADWPDTP